ncbi:MAG: hypothetical protein KGP12_02655 [Actinomycetales bacterium]|nr:hypothetical protein [Actinomycetales bacterium]
MTVTRRLATSGLRVIGLVLALPAALALAGCAGPTISPQRGIISLAAPSSPGPDSAPPPETVTPAPQDDPGADTPLCWAMLEGLPVMDDTGLDPSRAAFFVAWGRYMRDVDRYLSKQIPGLEAMVAQAPDDAWLAQQDAMEGVLRMQSSVHAASGRLLAATDPVDDAVVRVFTVASSDFLDGLGQACPSSRLADGSGQDMGLSMT